MFGWLVQRSDDAGLLAAGTGDETDDAFGVRAQPFAESDAAQLHGMEDIDAEEKIRVVFVLFVPPAVRGLRCRCQSHVGCWWLGKDRKLTTS